MVYVELPPNLIKGYENGGKIQFNNFQKEKMENYFAKTQYVNSHWVPVLPKLSLELEECELFMIPNHEEIPEFEIKWTVFCDESPENKGIMTHLNTQIKLGKSYENWLQNSKLA